MQAPVITCDRVSKSFGAVRAVSDVSFEVRPGELVGLVGPDGAGKTTLTRLAAGVLKPDSGAVIPESQGRVGYLAGRFSLYPELTVRENLRFFASLYGMPRTEIERESDRLLEWVGLAPFGGRLSGRLSGGMRQKLALLCAVIHRPPVLILDEPTTAVDPVARAEFWALLRSEAHSGRAVLVTTPYLDEAELCDRVGLLGHGQLLAIDTPAALRARLPWRTALLTHADDAAATHAGAGAGRRRAELLAVARALPGFRAAEPLGEGVRLALAPTAPLAAPAGFALTETQPTLEDVFIWLAAAAGVGEVGADD